MATNERPSTWQLVKIPAAITLVVTVARLTGELLGIDAPRWFGTEAGGGGAFVGIVWLVPIFGGWFGWRLFSARKIAKPGISIILHLFGLVLLVGGVFATAKFDLQMEFPVGLLVVGAFAFVCSLFAARAWPALYGVLLLYGLAARLPVALITVPAVLLGWGTHYERLPPGMEMPDLQRMIQLAGTQILMWVPFTILLGGLFGSFVAWMRKSRPTPQEP